MNDTQGEVRYPKRYQSTGPTFAAVGSGDCIWAQADLEDADQPVPYTLTAKAEALLGHEAEP